MRKWQLFLIIVIIVSVTFSGCNDLAELVQGSIPDNSSPTEYTVTFNANNATSGTAPAPQKVITGSSIVIPSEGSLSKNGFTFGGWNTDAAGTGDNYVAGSLYTVTSNITMYAEWNSNSSLSYNIGDTGPAGGKIFFYSETGFTMTDTGETCHYLEVDGNMALFQWASPQYWSIGNWLSIPSTSANIGAGRKNTALILALDPDAPAARFCVDYRGPNNFSDWFLPSKDELNLLYLNREAVGITTGAYWSSTEFSPDIAWALPFSTGIHTTAIYKSLTYNVRAVRAF